MLDPQSGQQAAECEVQLLGRVCAGDSTAYVVGSRSNARPNSAVF